MCKYVFNIFWQKLFNGKWDWGETVCMSPAPDVQWSGMSLNAAEMDFSRIVFASLADQFFAIFLLPELVGSWCVSLASATGVYDAQAGTWWESGWVGAVYVCMWLVYFPRTLSRRQKLSRTFCVGPFEIEKIMGCWAFVWGTPVKPFLFKRTVRVSSCPEDLAGQNILKRHQAANTFGRKMGTTFAFKRPVYVAASARLCLLSGFPSHPQSSMCTKIEIRGSRGSCCIPANLCICRPF